jgi:uncharacterized membrane protein
MNLIQTLFPGLAALANNVHPLFVHFPIAFWIGAFLLETLAIFRDEKLHGVATWLLHLGTLAAIVTLPTGFIAEYAAAAHAPGAHNASGHHWIHLHRNFMVATTLIGLGVSSYFLWVNRRGIWPFHRFGLLATTALLAVSVALGADRGARLVYEFGVGVHPDRLKPPVEGDAHSDAHSHE